MDGFILGKIATKRFEQRLVERDGDLLVSLGRGKAVRVYRGEWDMLVRDYRRAVGRANWYMWAAILLQLPNIILWLSLHRGVPAVRAALDWMDSWLPGLSIFCVLVSVPFAGMALHDRAIRRATKIMLRRLAERPRVDISALPRQRKLHAVEIIALVMFGPGVLIDVYGTIFPTAFDHTPWMGRELGWQSALGLVCFAVVVGRQAWLWATAPKPVAETAPAAPDATMRRRRALVAETADPA